MELKDNATIDVLFSTLIRNSVAFKILEAIFFEDCLSFIGPFESSILQPDRTLQAAMKDLQEALAKWKLTIHRRPFNQPEINGDSSFVLPVFFGKEN